MNGAGRQILAGRTAQEMDTDLLRYRTLLRENRVLCQINREMQRDIEVLYNGVLESRSEAGRVVAPGAPGVQDNPFQNHLLTSSQPQASDFEWLVWTNAVLWQFNEQLARKAGRFQRAGGTEAQES